MIVTTGAGHPRPRKRRRALLAMALAAALPLVACSGIGSESDGEADAPDDDGSGGNATITVAYIPDPTPFTGYLEGEVERFEEANPGIQVELQSTPGQQYANAVELQFGQSAPPDVFRLQPEKQFAERAYARGWVRDLSEYAADEFQARFPEGTFLPTGGLYRDGELISIPVNDGRWTGSRILFYNPDLLAEYGFDEPPATWDEMATMATTISAESDGEVYGFGLSQLWSRVEEYSWSFGEPLMKSNDGAGINPITGQAGYSQDNYTEAVEYYQRLVADNAVAPGWQNFTGQDLWPLFVNGQIAMFIAFAWNYPELVQLEPDFEVSAAPIPSQDGDSPRVYAQSTSVPYWAISSESEHPDEAWAFIDFLSSEESQIRFYEATGAPPALTPSIEDQIDEGVLGILEIGAESRILAPDPRFISTEGRRITEGLSDKVKPAGLRDALANAVDQGEPWGPVAEQLDSQLDTAVDEVIAELEAEGVDASRDDLTFPDWDPNSDFSQ